MKIRPVGAEIQTDGRTDRHDEASSRFSQFCEPDENTEPKNIKHPVCLQISQRSHEMAI
jgi:hypothetical protein